MKFAVIGLGGTNTFSKKMEKALKKRGHSVYLLNNAEIRNRYCPSVFKTEYHLNMKFPIDLREILPVDNYDAIIISHNAFVFNNPKIGSTKVIYYHREFLDYPSCMNPDILAYNMPNHDEFIRSYYPKLWYSTKKMDIPFAVDPEEFNPNREKDLNGLNFVSFHEAVMEERRDLFWNNLFKNHFEREKLFTSNGCRINGGKYVSFEEYKDYLERSEAFLNFSGSGVFGSRRLLECAACKTLAVIYIENEESKEYYNKLGFEHFENCIMFKNSPIFPTPYNSMELAANAYEMVLNNHTYDHRAQQIIELLK